MKNKSLLISIVFFILAMELFAQETDSFTDSRDGKSYKTVTIGQQLWTSENLDVNAFRNGDSIPHAKTVEEWIHAAKEKKPAWCYFDNSSVVGEKCGKLYNWFAIADSRGIAPAGWHVPDDPEWTRLTDYLTGSEASKKVKTSKGISEKGSSIKKSGFDGLPGGYRDENGNFNDFGFDGGWWSSTESSKEDAWGRGLYYLYGNVFRYDLSAQFCYYNKEFGLSVRCIRD